MIHASKTQPAITPVIGNAECGFNKPTAAEANAPTPICVPPIKAEALPACLVKGAIDKAEEFGKLKPWQLKYTNINAIVPYKCSQPMAVPAKSKMPAMVCIVNVDFTICWLLYFFSTQLFSWLLVIKPAAINANMPPYCCSVVPNNFINTNGDPAR